MGLAKLQLGVREKGQLRTHNLIFFFRQHQGGALTQKKIKFRAALGLFDERLFAGKK